MIESRFVDKNFVLRLELFPKADYLKFEVLKFSGVETVYVPINQIIPITKYDYWCAATWRPFFKQHQCLDFDMIYAHKTTKEMFLFDKYGEWNDDGVYHDALSMEKTYNETNWYDEFSPHNF